MLEIKHINKVYNKNRINSFTALKDVSLVFKQKGFHAIYGQSGSGKTTLFNCISGLDSIDNGLILYSGKELNMKEMDKFREENIGLIFQNYYLNNEETVYQNIIEVFLIRGVEDIKKADEKILKVLSTLGIKHLKNRKVAALSGGQQQRVAIARALVKSPKIILADEPTGNLDSENTKMILDILKELSKEISVVLISHEKDIVDQYADFISTMKSGVLIETVENNKTKMQLRVEKNRFNIASLEHSPYLGTTRQKLKNSLLNETNTFRFSKKQAFIGMVIFLLSLTLVMFSQIILGNLFPSENTASYYPNNTYIITAGSESDFKALLDDLDHNYILSSNIRDVEEYDANLPFYFLNTDVSIVIPSTYPQVGKSKGQLFSSKLLTTDSILVGSKDIEIQEVVISKYLADDLLFSLNKYFQYGIEEYDDLIGIPIEFENYVLEREVFIIKGISKDNSYSIYVHPEEYIHSHLKHSHESYALLKGTISESYNLQINELIINTTNRNEVGDTITYRLTNCYVEYLCDENMVEGVAAYQIEIPNFYPSKYIIDDETAEEYMIEHIISKSVLVDNTSKKIILLVSNSEDIDELLDKHFITAVNANDYLKDVRLEIAMSGGKPIFLTIGYAFLILVLIQVFRADMKSTLKQTAIKKLLGQQNRYIILSFLTKKFLKNIIITTLGILVGLHYIDLYQRDISNSLLDISNIINISTYLVYLLIFLITNLVGFIPSVITLRSKPIKLIKDISV